MGSSSKEVQRVTMFKIDDQSNISKIIEGYKVMVADSKKDGKPYILSFSVGPTDTSDPRSKGWAFASFSSFASMEDMKYYDDVDEAHQAMKQKLKPLISDLLTVYTQNVLSG